MRTVSDLFDLSIHFISFLFISLVFFLFLLPYTLLPYTFYFRDVVDNMPAHFAEELGTPWSKKKILYILQCWNNMMNWLQVISTVPRVHMCASAAVGI